MQKKTVGQVWLSQKTHGLKPSVAFEENAQGLSVMWLSQKTHGLKQTKYKNIKR